MLWTKKVFISESDQNHDTKKEQALSITFSQCDWFISQNERSWLAITLRDKLTRAWREQRCLDSHQQQIIQSECEITSNCRKNPNYWNKAMPCLHSTCICTCKSQVTWDTGKHKGLQYIYFWSGKQGSLSKFSLVISTASLNGGWVAGIYHGLPLEGSQPASQPLDRVL